MAQKLPEQYKKMKQAHGEARETTMGIITDAMLELGAAYGTPMLPLIKAHIVPRLLVALQKTKAHPKSVAGIMKTALLTPQKPYGPVDAMGVHPGWDIGEGQFSNPPGGARSITIGTKWPPSGRMEANPRASWPQLKDSTQTLAHELSHAHAARRAAQDPGSAEAAMRRLRQEMGDAFDWPEGRSYEAAKFWVNLPTEVHADVLAELISRRPMSRAMSNKQFGKLSERVAEEVTKTAEKRLRGKMALEEPREGFYNFWSDPNTSRISPGSKFMLLKDRPNIDSGKLNRIRKADTLDVGLDKEIPGLSKHEKASAKFEIFKLEAGHQSEALTIHNLNKGLMTSPAGKRTFKIVKPVGEPTAKTGKSSVRKPLLSTTEIADIHKKVVDLIHGTHNVAQAFPDLPINKIADVDTILKSIKAGSVPEAVGQWMIKHLVETFYRVRAMGGPL